MALWLILHSAFQDRMEKPTVPLIVKRLDSFFMTLFIGDDPSSYQAEEKMLSLAPRPRLTPSEDCFRQQHRPTVNALRLRFMSLCV